MKLKTLTPITIAQARQFEDEQGLKGIKKENIFSQEDCNWELEVTERKMENGFSAKVKWFQIQQYEDIDENGNPITRELSRLMYQENFILSPAEVDGMFNQMNIPIVPNQDSFSQKVDEIVLNGIIYWIGVVRQIFGLDPSGFEVIDANRPAPEQITPSQKEDLEFSDGDAIAAEKFMEKTSGFSGVLDRPEETKSSKKK